MKKDVEPLYFLIATHSSESKGGISSSVKIFENSIQQLEIDYVRINSHSEMKAIFPVWLKATCRILRLSKQHAHRRRVYWFHCGPWFSMFRKFALALVSKSKGGENVIHFHSYALINYLSSWYGRLLLKIFLLPFDKIVALTPWWKKQIKQAFPHIPVRVIPNPVSFRLLDLAKSRMDNLNRSAPKTSDNIKIFTMARLAKGKGVEQVIRAMACLPSSYELTVAGDGPIKGDLNKLTSKLGLNERVTFTGWLNDHEKEKMLCASDIFCLPSFDSFGIVFIEAMSVGLPIIALNSAPISEVVTPDVGILVNSQADDIANSIRCINQQESTFTGGPKLVVEHYNPIHLTHKIIAFLNEQLQSR